MSEYTLVNPTTEPVTPPFDGAPRLPTLAGARLGIIDDSKRNADVLLQELAEVLRTRYEIGDVQWHRKPSASPAGRPGGHRSPGYRLRLCGHRHWGLRVLQRVQCARRDSRGEGGPAFRNHLHRPLYPHGQRHGQDVGSRGLSHHLHQAPH